MGGLRQEAEDANILAVGVPFLTNLLAPRLVGAPAVAGWLKCGRLGVIIAPAPNGPRVVLVQFVAGIRDKIENWWLAHAGALTRIARH